MRRFRPAIGVGKQQVVVLCGFGSEGDCQLLGGCHLCTERHERQLEVSVALLPELQKSTRVIHTAVVDHNHLIFGIILREQRLHIVAQVLLLVLGADDDAHAGLLAFCALLPLSLCPSYRCKDIPEVEVHLVHPHRGERAQHHLLCQ